MVRGNREKSCARLAARLLKDTSGSSTESGRHIIAGVPAPATNMQLEILGGFFAALTTGILAVWLTLRVCLHINRGIDQIGSGRKIHPTPTPRLGGIGILIAYVAALALLKRAGYPFELTTQLLMASLPVFLAGVVEDITGNVGAALRYCAGLFSALLGCALIGARLHRIDIPGIDALFDFRVVSILFSIFATASVAHAMNLIDGCNGLAGMTSVVGFAAICLVAALAGDREIALAAALAAGTFAGFLLLNFPMGRIFLGDGGAYFAGFVLAQLSILLVNRNDSVSAWFPVLLLCYPIWETLFTVYRRAVLQGVSIAMPDRLHLHHLVFHRVIRWNAGATTEDISHSRGNMASIFMWGFVLLGALPALLFWNNVVALMLSAILYIAVYNTFYARLVKFRTPMIWRGPAFSTLPARPDIAAEKNP